MSTARVRLTSACFTVAGLLFVLYPAIRPFSDEKSLQGTAAFGSTDPEGFTPEMGAELVAFLARVVERTAERWPLL